MMRPLARVLAVAAPAVGSAVLAGGIAVSASSASAHAGAAPSGAFRVTDEYHPTISITKLGTKSADSQSSNWSGYNQGILETDTPTTSISGQWVVPKATQHTKHQAEDSATWIGIGGGCLDPTCDATDSTLIQAGTEQDISSTGKASYDAWYEIIPAPELESSIKVHPGNIIRCSITQVVPGLWTVSLKDTSDGQSFTETLPYPSDESTAEWIEETPTEIGTSGTGTAALPKLTTVHFEKARVNGATARLVADQAIQLVNSNNRPIATPSAPVGGNKFNDCAWAKTCAKP
jgi:Peptidase A4 family